MMILTRGIKNPPIELVKAVQEAEEKLDSINSQVTEEQKKLEDKRREVKEHEDKIWEQRQKIRALDQEIAHLNLQIENIKHSDIYARGEEVRKMEQEIAAARDAVNADAEGVRAKLSKAINDGRTAADESLNEYLDKFKALSQELQREMQDEVMAIREEENHRLAEVRNEVTDLIQKEQLAMYKVQYKALAVVAYNMIIHVRATRKMSMELENSTDLAALHKELERQAENEDGLLRNLMRALAKLGIEEITPEAGTVFDPEFHTTENGDEGQIIRTKAPGILIRQNGMEEVLVKALVETVETADSMPAPGSPAQDLPVQEISDNSDPAGQKRFEETRDTSVQIPIE